MEKVELRKIYYYNNRPVVTIRQEDDNFFFVSAHLSLDHDVTGSSFCHGCQVGHYHHDCENAAEIIEIVMENISDEECFWVNKIYLREHPFEYKEYTKLKDEIYKLKEEKESLEILNRAVESVKIGAEKELEQLRVQIQQLESTYEANTQVISEQLAEIEELRNNYKPSVQVKGTTIKLSADRVLTLLKDQIILGYLEAGGVNNWEWYGENFPEDFDLDAEAFEKFKNL